MGLVIGLKEEDAFYVGDVRVEVDRILNPKKFRLKVTGPVDQMFMIDDTRSTEIMPQVMVSAGLSRDHWMVRAVIDAPRNIKILREKLYVKPQDQGD